jgi:hypothetical protein
VGLATFWTISSPTHPVTLSMTADEDDRNFRLESCWRHRAKKQSQWRRTVVTLPRKRQKAEKIHFNLWTFMQTRDYFSQKISFRCLRF